MKLIIASNNKGKIREYKQILEPLGYEVVSQKEAGADIEVEETGTTFAENSQLKAQAIYDMFGCAVLADDSGLEIDALDGEPGVYSARYGGLDKDTERTALVLEKMKDVPEEKREAHFTCSICFIDETGKRIMAEGKVFGAIAYEPKGENGFGYDPIFIYEGKTFAEHTAELKNSVSHRANALKDLEKKLGAKQ